MCPACVSSMAWLITGGVSALSGIAGGIVILRDRTIAKSKALTCSEEQDNVCNKAMDIPE